MKARQGFTLMELLVVLLIIGILSTVALRTIDATRDRALFDQTANEMNKLVQAMVGNPDLTYDGRRVDFGFFGDQETLPRELKDLVVNPGSRYWHGPYLRLTLGGDTASYLYDGWGHHYTWMRDLGLISTEGGKYQMTVKVADTVSQLYDNIICGTITDADNNPPGEQSMTPVRVKMYYNNLELHPDTFAFTIPDPGGYYEFSPSSPTPNGAVDVPIGIHKVTVEIPGETLTRYVTVVPRSRTVVDFKFSKSFWDKLLLIGTPTMLPDNSGFFITIASDQPEDVTISWLVFKEAPDAAFMRDFTIKGIRGTGFPIPDNQPGIGPGDTVKFAPVTIGPNLSDEVELAFLDFHVDELGNGAHAQVNGKTFLFRFSDGSEITVNTPP